MAAAVKRKEQSIETLRGIAIILMVAGHVIGDNSGTGLQVRDESVWRYFYFTFEYLRMPLFTAISGFVYALKPVQSDHIGRFLKGKSRRIILPFFTVATVQYLMNALVPQVNNPVPLADIWKIYIFSYGQFWFLQALFLVFLTVVALEYNKILDTIKGWAISLGIAVIMLLVINQNYLINYFSISRYLYLLPFFLLGIGLNRFKNQLFKKPIILALLLTLIITVTIQQLEWFEVINTISHRFSAISVFVGISGIWLIFHIRKPFKWLAELGYYSYGIYLFHVFATAGSRIFAKMLGMENMVMLFFTGLIFGLIFPILLELILLKSAILRRLFLGLR
ncbi:MAG TPA: acyltransferase [Bacteroidales bacterium]|nr:acyltransferase [Bacteroidales bacterium]